MKKHKKEGFKNRSIQNTLPSAIIFAIFGLDLAEVERTAATYYNGVSVGNMKTFSEATEPPIIVNNLQKPNRNYGSLGE